MPKLTLRGKKPSDLPEVSTSWTDWTLTDRIHIAKSIPGYSIEELQSAVAITLNEQPNKIPVNNCCGLMCWGTAMPWGWKSELWQNCQPNGYALIQEGSGGMLGVFLAFGSVKDSLTFLLKVVHSRGITSAEVYADKWVAVPKLRESSIAGFTTFLNRVKANWVKGLAVNSTDDVENWPLLKKGTSGKYVETLQRLLNDRGYPVPITGNFLDKTKATVIAFQKNNKDKDGNPLEPDGKVGPKTWWSLTNPR